ncbi:MAG: MoaD/ThiS family protein [Aeromicrobium sp.]
MQPVRVRLFAAAREAAGTSETTVEAATIGDVLDALTARFEDLGPVLTRCSVLLEGTRTTDRSAPVPAEGTVDVLPPYAGG